MFTRRPVACLVIVNNERRTLLNKRNVAYKRTTRGVGADTARHVEAETVCQNSRKPRESSDYLLPLFSSAEYLLRHFLTK